MVKDKNDPVVFNMFLTEGGDGGLIGGVVFGIFCWICKFNFFILH